MVELKIEHNKPLMEFLTKKAEERGTSVLAVVEYYVREYRCRYLKN